MTRSVFRGGGRFGGQRSEKDRKEVKPRLTANEMFTHLSCNGAHHVLRSKVALEETRQRDSRQLHIKVLCCSVVWCCSGVV